MDVRRAHSIQGKLYGEIASWITVIGMSIALMGIIICAFTGEGVFYYKKLMADLLSGKGEQSIWRSCSTFAEYPSKYWFFKRHICVGEISMIGIVIACYGSIVGLVAMLVLMFREKDVLFYKNGLYTVLTLLITTIVILAATGIIALRH